MLPGTDLKAEPAQVLCARSWIHDSLEDWFLWYWKRGSRYFCKTFERRLWAVPREKAFSDPQGFLCITWGYNRGDGKNIVYAYKKGLSASDSFLFSAFLIAPFGDVSISVNNRSLNQSRKHKRSETVDEKKILTRSIASHAINNIMLSCNKEIYRVSTKNVHQKRPIPSERKGVGQWNFRGILSAPWDFICDHFAEILNFTFYHIFKFEKFEETDCACKKLHGGRL